MTTTAPRRTLWEGRVLAPVPRYARDGLKLAVFVLEGRMAPKLRAKYTTAQQDTGVAFPAYLASTAFDHAANPGTGTGTRGSYVAGAVTTPTLIRQTFFDGRLAGYMDDLVRFSGMWSVEDRLGFLRMVEPSSAGVELVRQGSEVTYGPTTHTIYRDGTYGHEATGLVRNVATLVQRDTSEPFEWMADITGPSAAGVVQTIDADDAGIPSDVTVVNVISVLALPGNETILRDVTSGARASFGIEYENPNAPASSTYSYRILAHLGTPSNGATQDVSIASSTAIYDERELDLPQWYAAADFPRGEAWVQYRSTPPIVTVLEMPLWQEDMAKSQEVARIEPGYTISLQLTAPPVRHERALVLGVEYEHDVDRVPRKRVACVRTAAATTAGTMRWDIGRWDTNTWG